MPMRLNEREKDLCRCKVHGKRDKGGEESGDAMTYLVGIPQCDWQDQLLCSLCNVVGLEELGLHP